MEWAIKGRLDCRTWSYINAVEYINIQWIGKDKEDIVENEKHFPTPGGEIYFIFRN